MTRMHADEIEIDGALARRLVAAQFPEWAGLPLVEVRPRGTDNALFRLGDSMVVRLPRTERTNVTLQKERQWLGTVAPLLPVEAPRPLADGSPTPEYLFAWSVYSWLEGEPATVDRLENPARTAADLADFLTALQHIDPAGGPPPGEHNFFRGAPLALRDRPTREAIGALDWIDRRAVTDAWEAALAAGEWTHAPVWIHGDLDSRNVIARDGRVAGVIDWGGLAVGDPACDVMVAWKMLPAASRPAFRNRLAVDEATWTRARGWVVSQAVIALAYYTAVTNPTLVGEARRWLAEVNREPPAGVS
jgi:aminoglycoside phosphotransferase (APT) family kinase protein